MPGTPANDTQEKERPVPRWHPGTRADRNRKKDREEKTPGGAGQGKASSAAASPAAGPGTDGTIAEYAPDAFDLERVRCACGRWTFALCMVDVRGVPAALRGEAEEVCDGCWTRWVREEKVTRAELARMQGAPPEVIEHIQEHGHPHLP